MSNGRRKVDQSLGSK